MTPRFCSLRAALYLLVMAPLAMTTSAAIGNNGSDKVMICHNGTDDPTAGTLLSISEHALDAHFGKHVDHIVGPEVCDGVDNDCDGELDEVSGCHFHACGELAPVAGDGCSVTVGTEDTIWLQGTVLAGAGHVFAGGGVLWSSDGEILCVGCDCDTTGATVVSCPDGVVSPGLINTHDHLNFNQNIPGGGSRTPGTPPAPWGTERYENRYQWLTGDGGTKIEAPGGATAAELVWAELRHVIGGTTSVMGQGSKQGFARNVDTLGAQEGRIAGKTYFDSFPLGSVDPHDADCLYPDEPWSGVTSAYAYSPHVAEGIDEYARNELICMTRDAPFGPGLGGGDFAGSNTVFIHGVGLLAEDGEALAREGVAVSWAPRSNIALYGATATVTMLQRQGVLLALGTDWTASGSVNLTRELACADQLNRDYLGDHFTTRELWEMATSNGAQALGIAGAIGSLEPGLLADIAVFDGSDVDDPFRAVIDGFAGDTLLVLRGGTPLFGDSDVVSALPTAAPCDEVPGGVCGRSRQACVESETGLSLVSLMADNLASYDLFFCGVPLDEPSCTPFRAEGDALYDYSGERTADDADGDGIPGEHDNCPGVFNPIRPLDGTAQADADLDGRGDACDPCPTGGSEGACPAGDPSDRDADGVPNAEDNCYADANPEQMDTDGDLVGDACDRCAGDYDPQNVCPIVASIYAIKRGGHTGQRVRVLGVVSSVANLGRGADGLHIQVPEMDHGPDGYDYSGIFVYTFDNSALSVGVGDLVEVDGEVQSYFGQRRLGDFVEVYPLGANIGEPSPVVKTPAGFKAAAVADHRRYDSVFAQIEGVVTDDDAGFGEYTLDDAFNVNDDNFDSNPLVDLGDRVRVTGTLRRSFNRQRMEPRSADDVVILP